MNTTYSAEEIAQSGSAADIAARNRTFRRVIFRFIPFLTFIWFMAWIDRVNIGFAKLTMMEDLQWTDAIYGAGAGIFFIAYFLFELPSNLLLEKIGARKTIMRIAMGWGIVSVLMSLVDSAWQFYLLRFLQGAFEAGLQPGVLLFLTYWLPAHRRGKAMAFFLSASAMSLMIGSPLAAGIMEAFNGMLGLHGWQWLFIIEGMPSVIAGALVWIVLCDRPHKAKWLSPAEKEHIYAELNAEEKALGHRESNAFASLRQRPTWIIIIAYFCIVAANATLTFYGPSIVGDAGIDNIVTLGWTMSGIYLCGWIGMIGNGWVSDKIGNPRATTIGAAFLGASGLLGAMIFTNMGSLVGVILSLAISSLGTMGAISSFWSLPPLIMSGSALVAGLAVINSIANLAGYFAPQLLGSLKDMTGSYSLGLIIIAAVELLGVFMMVVFIKPKPIKEIENVLLEESKSATPTP